MPGADHGATVQAHPLTDLPQRLRIAGRDRPASVRADVQQHVATHRDRVDQHLHEHGGGLLIGVVAVIAPGPVERLAGLPGQRHAVTHDRRGRLVLLGGNEVGRNAQTVVDEHVRLQLPAQREQRGGVPVVGSLAR